MRIFLILLVAVVASTSSFIVHVATVEWLPGWIGEQMHGIQLQASWQVRYAAAVTSLEYGAAAMGFYLLARDKLAQLGTGRAILLMSVMLTALHGALLRQPLMDYLVGNPWQVVVVQNGFKWLVWVLMATLVVTGSEAVLRHRPRLAVGQSRS